MSNISCREAKKTAWEAEKTIADLEKQVKNLTFLKDMYKADYEREIILHECAVNYYKEKLNKARIDQ